MNFLDFYFKEEIEDNDVSLCEIANWRLKKIWHTTPEGSRNRVQIRSLPSSEQWKYAPAYIRNKRRIRRAVPKGGYVDNTSPDINLDNISSSGLIFYYGVESQSDAPGIVEDAYIKATINPEVAYNEFTEKDMVVVRVEGVSVGAVIQYKRVDGDWEKFDNDISDEEKLEMINSGEYEMFLLNLFPYKDDLKLNFFKPDVPLENAELDNDGGEDL